MDAQSNVAVGDASEGFGFTITLPMRAEMVPIWAEACGTCGQKTIASPLAQQGDDRVDGAFQRCAGAILTASAKRAI